MAAEAGAGADVAGARALAQADEKKAKLAMSDIGRGIGCGGIGGMG